MTMPATDAWSYSGDPAASDTDAVRYYLQDVDVDVRLLSDAEIAFEIDKWADLGNGSMIYVASEAALRVAAKFAGVTRVQGDGVDVDFSTLNTAYTMLSKQLRDTWEREQATGEVDLSNLMWCATIDPSLAPLRFGVGHMDNPAAGEQDYGGEHQLWWLSELIAWPG